MSSDSLRYVSSLQYLTKAMDYFEKVIGDFPYTSLSIVDKGISENSGMEYPGLITVSGSDSGESDLQYYLVHELLHQYFYSALAFNQRKHSWLDEGLTTYYQQRYYKDMIGVDHYSSKYSLILHEGQQPILQTVARGQATRHMHTSISSGMSDFSPLNFGMNTYEVPARMFAYLTDYLGDDVFDRGMQNLLASWSEKHPYPIDLQTILEKESGRNLSWFFEELIEGDWSYDYRIDGFENGNLVVEHRSGSQPPYKVTFGTQEGEETMDKWIDGHHGKQTYKVE